jgi:hypothetical protein
MPSTLVGSHTGYDRFDPLVFPEEFDLYCMQECELRHGPLGILAAWDGAYVISWHRTEIYRMDVHHRSSIELNPLSFLAMLAALGAFTLFETKCVDAALSIPKLGDLHKSHRAFIWKYGIVGDDNSTYTICIPCWGSTPLEQGTA